MRGTMPAPRAARQPVMPSTWFESPLAQELLLEEQRSVLPLLTAQIGVRGLYLRPGRSYPEALSGNMVQSLAKLHRESWGFAGDLLCGAEHLPFESESICLLYALHSLDQAREPAQFADELARVLRPEGMLFLIGLSPYSAWRLRWQGRGPRAVAAGAARGWLSAAGLQVERQLGLGPLLPGRRIVPGRGVPSGGRPWTALRGGYLLVARKRRAGQTAVGPRTASLALQPRAQPGLAPQ